MADVMEIARFGVLEGADLTAAEGIAAWLAAQPGFVSRTLVGPDAGGRYTDLVRWRSMDDARAAAAAMPSSPDAGAFMAIVDPSTVEMQHLEVQLTQ